MMRRLLVVCTLALAALGGCTYYVAPGASPASFDRSFTAASNAMLDQGLQITQQDRTTGMVVGRLDSGSVTARITPNPDGSVRVQFDGAGLRDPNLLERVSRSYDYRMGR